MIIKGLIRFKISSRKAVGSDSKFGSRPAIFAALIVGVPIAPNAGDAALPIRQITAAEMGSNPRPTIIAAGIATAVPKPAIPSIKLEKPQPRIRATIRLSLDTEPSIPLIISMAPVCRLIL